MTLAAEGARVAILGRNGNAARDVEQGLRGKGQEAISLPNSISPGFVRTAMSVVNGVDETTTERFMSHYVKLGRIPLRRAGLPEESLRRQCFSRQGNAVT